MRDKKNQETETVHDEINQAFYDGTISDRIKDQDTEETNEQLNEEFENKQNIKHKGQHPSSVSDKDSRN